MNLLSRLRLRTKLALLIGAVRPGAGRLARRRRGGAASTHDRRPCSTSCGADGRSDRRARPVAGRQGCGPPAHQGTGDRPVPSRQPRACALIGRGLHLGADARTACSSCTAPIRRLKASHHLRRTRRQVDTGDHQRGSARRRRGRGDDILFVRPGQTPAAARSRLWPLRAVGPGVLAGAYIDDLDAAFLAKLWELVGIARRRSCCAVLLAAWLINRDITGLAGRIETAMGRLAHGELARRHSGRRPARRGRRNGGGGAWCSRTGCGRRRGSPPSSSGERCAPRTRSEALSGMAEGSKPKARRARWPRSSGGRR